MKPFYILAFDINGSPTGVVGKKAWDTREEAEEHASVVLQSQPNSFKFTIVGSLSVVQRSNPPIEVIHLDFEDHPNLAAA